MILVSASRAYTYCKEQVPGGMTGTHSCNNPIPLGETMCPTCKSQWQTQPQAPDSKSSTDLPMTMPANISLKS